MERNVALCAGWVVLLAGATFVAACVSSGSTTARTGDAPAEVGARTPVAHAVRGKVVDLEGAPVVDVYVTVSTELCVPDRTAPTGAFTVRNVLPGGSKRLILYGPTASGGPYASLAFAFSGADVADLDFANPIVAPRLLEPLPYEPAIAAPQRLATADGFAITVRAADLHVEGFGGPKLFAIQVPIERAPPFGDVLSRLHVLYVLEPLQSTLAKPSPVELPNPKRLRAGAKVDIYQLDYWKGVLVARAKGHVRNDGKVVSDDSEGLTELTWVGFAPSTRGAR